MCMEDLLPSLSVLLRCLRCVNFFCKKKPKRELSEYKAIGMIQDHVSLLYQAIQRNTQNLTKILIRLFDLLQKNGRKSHRYEKKTIFDIMGVVYEYNGFGKKKKAA
jgi:hypothetical protein